MINQNPQNFSVPSGYDESVTFNVDPAVKESLVDTEILWRLYDQSLGIPGEDPILEKSTADSSIIKFDSPLSFVVQLLTEDTISLLGNYYHEATIYDSSSGEVIGGSWGIMTVTETQNR